MHFKLVFMFVTIFYRDFSTRSIIIRKLCDLVVLKQLFFLILLRFTPLSVIFPLDLLILSTCRPS